jgi:UDP-N-acetylglucosamine 2-epimerase (non-hydrolysing)
MGVPCLTVRPNTERPVTIHQGTNRLVENTSDAIVCAIEGVLNSTHQPIRSTPELWDGRTASRILDVFMTMHGEARHISS